MKLGLLSLRNKIATVQKGSAKNSRNLTGKSNTPAKTKAKEQRMSEAAAELQKLWK